MILSSTIKWTSNRLKVKKDDSLKVLQSKMEKLNAVRISLQDKLSDNIKFIRERKGNSTVIVGTSEYYDDVGIENAKIKLKQVEQQLEKAKKFIEQKEQENA